MQKILKAPTLIGIRRAVLEYSFENFTILGKKKNGKVCNETLPFLDEIVRWLGMQFCTFRSFLRG